MWSRVSDRCQSKASGAWCNYNRQAAPCFLVAFVCVVIYPHICLNLSCQLQAAVVKAVSAQKRFMHAKLSISANYDKGTVQKGVKYFCNYIASIHPDEGATPSPNQYSTSIQPPTSPPTLLPCPQNGLAQLCMRSSKTWLSTGRFSSTGTATQVDRSSTSRHLIARASLMCVAP
jgi:hypothetical protein